MARVHTRGKLDQILHSQRRESHAQSAALESAHLGRQAALAGSEMLPPLNSVTGPVFSGISRSTYYSNSSS